MDYMCQSFEWRIYTPEEVRIMLNGTVKWFNAGKGFDLLKEKMVKMICSFSAINVDG